MERVEISDKQRNELMAEIHRAINFMEAMCDNAESVDDMAHRVNFDTHRLDGESLRSVRDSLVGLQRDLQEAVLEAEWRWREAVYSAGHKLGVVDTNGVDPVAYPPYPKISFSDARVAAQGE